MSKYKVVFHIDEMGKWGLLLKNVTNLLDAAGKAGIRVEVLANSEAVRYFDPNRGEQADAGAPEALHQRGVKFAACRHALELSGMDEKTLPAFVKTVPAGVMELVKKQRRGYAYIKP